MSDAPHAPRVPSAHDEASHILTIDELFAAGLLVREGSAPPEPVTSSEYWEAAKRGNLSHTLPLRAALRVWMPEDDGARARRDTLLATLLSIRG